jgi:hypothetical protein
MTVPEIVESWKRKGEKNMYVMTLMCWSDVAMGDGNPQTAVVLRETLDEIKQLVVEMTNEQWGPCDEDDNPAPVKTYEEAIAFLKDAPESPELDIHEIVVGGEWVNLTRDVLDDHARMFNGKREIE